MLTVWSLKEDAGGRIHILKNNEFIGQSGDEDIMALKYLINELNELENMIAEHGESKE